MPTYEYECKSCGHLFEVFQSMRDAPLKSCPQCGKDVRRLINGGSGVIFKGSGFYVTDKKGGSSAAASDGAKSPAKTPETPTTGTPAGSAEATTSPSSAEKTVKTEGTAEKKAAG